MNEKSKSEKYQYIIENINQLPALPQIVSRLISVVNSPDTSADDAAELIEKDPALTSKVLRLANSAFYGMPRSVSSVSSAVVILGFNTIKSIVLSASVIKIFPQKKNISAFDRLRFWKHSIICAMAARHIAHSIMSAAFLDPQSAFCAGIMHDVGKLIFELFTPNDYIKACNFSKEKQIPLQEAEKSILGITHAEIGHILADKWALPFDLELAIVYHHSPKNSKNDSALAALIYIADNIAHKLNCGLWEKEAFISECEDAKNLISLDDKEYENILSSVNKEIESYKDFFYIISA